MIFRNPVLLEEEEKEQAKKLKEMLARESILGSCKVCHKQIATNGGPGDYDSKLCRFCDRIKRYSQIKDHLFFMDTILKNEKINMFLEAGYSKSLFTDPIFRWEISEQIKQINPTLSLIPVELVCYYFRNKKLNFQIDISQVEEIIKNKCDIRSQYRMDKGEENRISYIFFLGVIAIIGLFILASLIMYIK